MKGCLEGCVIVKPVKITLDSVVNVDLFADFFYFCRVRIKIPIIR